MAKTHTKTTQPETAHPNNSGTNGKWLFKNILFLLLAFLLVKITFTEQPAYKWVYYNLLKGNMSLIKQYPDLSFEQKMQMKLGANYEYLHFIKQSTPENAVILYPSQEAFSKEGSPFAHIYNKIYATRFLYPRKLVLESEFGVSKYADQINYVAIVNGEGKDKLSYPTDSTYRHGVLPINPQK